MKVEVNLPRDVNVSKVAGRENKERYVGIVRNMLKVYYI